MTTTTATCSICYGSGWDDAFGSPCSDCGTGALVADEADAKRRFDALQGQASEAAAADVALAAWLAEQTWSDFAQSLSRGFNSRGCFTIKQRDAAKAMRTKCEARTSSPSTEAPSFRWAKYGSDQWGVRGPEGHEHTEVTVTKASGETATVALDEVADARKAGSGQVIYAVARRQPADEGAVTEPGIYYLPGEPVTIFKVQPSRSSDRVWAKQLETDGSWTYVGRKPLNAGLVKLDAETATQFGHAYGLCACCGRLLTNEDSIEAGIGPVCASRL